MNVGKLQESLQWVTTVNDKLFRESISISSEKFRSSVDRSTSCVLISISQESSGIRASCQNLNQPSSLQPFHLLTFSLLTLQNPALNFPNLITSPTSIADLQISSPSRCAAAVSPWTRRVRNCHRTMVVAVLDVSKERAPAPRPKHYLARTARDCLRGLSISNAMSAPIQKRSHSSATCAENVSREAIYLSDMNGLFIQET